MRTTQPTLEAKDDATEVARRGLARFVEELQRGLDDGDADAYNRHFAADVLWGSPYGLVLQGYDRLHAIHAMLLSEGRGGRSRYEIEQVCVPAPDVLVAHVRRTALDDPRSVPIDSAGGFSEMALYVLVRRDGEWWLAAGQNTVIAPDATPPSGGAA